MRYLARLLNLPLKNGHLGPLTREVLRTSYNSSLQVYLPNTRHQHYESKSQENELSKYLKARIRATGPITVAEYMKTVLTHPSAGYYMHRDVFGIEGDFITAPEISQLFGELLGVWCVNEWIQCGKPPKIQVVEFGPGRGTLAYDLLRVFSQFPAMRDAVSLHLVEVSNKMSEMQYQKLVGHTLFQECNNNSFMANAVVKEPESYNHCISKFNIPVNWYHKVEDVPQEFSCFIAHEFFDALPIHKFQKTEQGWCEVFVDIDDNPASINDFKFTLSKSLTPALVCFDIDKNDPREHIEVSLESGAIIERISHRITENGGFALITDYGHQGEKTDTLRGFHKHTVLDNVLSEPGSSDLTADVDFKYLSKMAGDKVNVFGPISQAEFLNNMGIAIRLQVLLQKVQKQQRKDLISGYKMLTEATQMGQRYKFLSFMQKKKESEYKPAGFVNLNI